jgi:hypothetical protein
LSEKFASLHAITNDPSFGERRSNQWKARKRPELMAKLIRTHLGEDLQETEPIVKLLAAIHTSAKPEDRRQGDRHATLR